jgi:hypothetical protein
VKPRTADDPIASEFAMTEKTILAVPGKKLPVPRPLKRTLQVSMALALSALVALAFVVANSMLLGRGPASQAVATWLAFIKRPDIQATAILTAIVTVYLVYRMRDSERR